MSDIDKLCPRHPLSKFGKSHLVALGNRNSFPSEKDFGESLGRERRRFDRTILQYPYPTDSLWVIKGTSDESAPVNLTTKPH